jgi:hypothetical protein
MPVSANPQPTADVWNRALIALRMIGLVFLFSGASVGFMASDDATCRRSQKAMMRGIMPRYATDKCALQAALCFRR